MLTSGGYRSKPQVVQLLLFFWLAIVVFTVTHGPRLGDHEVIVAQIARQALDTGDWLVPHYLDLPFLMKPPFTPWLIAAFGTLLPNDGVTGLPVTAFAARLPSVVATVLTIWIVFCLARTMFERRVAWIAAFLYATALGALLYAVNATTEALLTLFCTWAFAEFWWSRQAASSARRRLHLLRFYVALGLAMLAKGPMPLIVVAAPLAVWWWCDRPTRLLARSGPAGILPAARLGLRQAPRRLRHALAGLGLWWGLPVFLLLFLPWMLLVARREPYAWALWRYEYLDRAQGQYPGSHPGRFLYYLPILFGLLIPWCLSLPEAFIGPFRKAYHRDCRPLTYAWYWVTVGLAVLSIMSFKKPYYILPLVPGCVLLLAPVLDRFFFGATVATARRQSGSVAVLVGCLAIALVIGWFVVRAKYSDVWCGGVIWAGPLFAMVILAVVAVAGVLFVRKHRRWSLAFLGGASLLVFVTIWYVLGPALTNAEAPITLVRRLEEFDVPSTAELYWAGNRPEGSVLFYGQRMVHYVFDPYTLITDRAKDQNNDASRLAVAQRLCTLFESPAPVYVVFQRGEFETLMALFHAPARALFSVDRGKVGPDKNDWIVATNAGPIG